MIVIVIILVLKIVIVVMSPNYLLVSLVSLCLSLSTQWLRPSRTGVYLRFLPSPHCCPFVNVGSLFSVTGAMLSVCGALLPQPRHCAGTLPKLHQSPAQGEHNGCMSSWDNFWWIGDTNKNVTETFADSGDKNQTSFRLVMGYPIRGSSDWPGTDSEVRAQIRPGTLLEAGKHPGHISDKVESPVRLESL